MATWRSSVFWRMVVCKQMILYGCGACSARLAPPSINRFLPFAWVIGDVSRAMSSTWSVCMMRSETPVLVTGGNAPARMPRPYSHGGFGFEHLDHPAERWRGMFRVRPNEVDAVEVIRRSLQTHRSSILAKRCGSRNHAASTIAPARFITDIALVDCTQPLFHAIDRDADEVRRGLGIVVAGQAWGFPGWKSQRSSGIAAPLSIWLVWAPRQIIRLARRAEQAPQPYKICLVTGPPRVRQFPIPYAAGHSRISTTTTANPTPVTRSTACRIAAR